MVGGESRLGGSIIQTATRKTESSDFFDQIGGRVVKTKTSKLQAIVDEAMMKSM